MKGQARSDLTHATQNFRYVETKLSLPDVVHAWAASSLGELVFISAVPAAPSSNE